jgi:hypothetical protein
VKNVRGRNKLMYKGILEVRRLSYERDVNRALEIEWTLLEICALQEAEGGPFHKEMITKLVYIVGRDKNGRPDPKNWIQYPNSSRKPRKRISKKVWNLE